MSERRANTLCSPFLSAIGRPDSSGTKATEICGAVGSSIEESGEGVIELYLFSLALESLFL